MPQNKITPIRLTPQEKLNWDSKLIHKFLKLSKNDQERALKLIDRVISKDAIIKVSNI